MSISVEHEKFNNLETDEACGLSKIVTTRYQTKEDTKMVLCINCRFSLQVVCKGKTGK